MNDPATLAPDTATENLALHHRVEHFLNHEASLMDGHAYEQWLALWAPRDIRYWVPCNSDDQDPKTELAIIYDDRRRLEERIARMLDPTAHAYHPRPRLMRVIGSLSLSRTGNELVRVNANFSLGQISRGHQTTWFGRSEHCLLPGGEAGFTIQSKKVLLLNNDEPMPNLNFLV